MEEFRTNPHPLSIPDDRTEKSIRTVKIHAFLTRRIGLCLLPLVLLAVYLAIYNVYTLQARLDQDADDRVRNVATAVDRHIAAQISALQMLAASPLIDDPHRREELYREAQGFRESFGGHVILADLSMQMLFHTRSPFGAALPLLPRPKGHAAASAVIETGKPSVGDMFFGPIAREPLVAAVVPVIRDGRIRFLLLSIIEIRNLQHRLDEVALPAGCSLKIIDGKNEVMAHRSPPEMEHEPADMGARRRFTAKSAVSYWSVVLEVPHGVYRAPVVTAAAALSVAVLLATLVSVLGGWMIGRRLTREVTSLTDKPPPETSGLVIAEIESVRTMLNDAGTARDSSEKELLESVSRFRTLAESAPVGIVISDKNEKSIYANRRFTDLLGYTLEDMPSVEEWWPLAYPDEKQREMIRSKWTAAVDKAARTHSEVEPVEYPVTCKDGTVRQIEFRLASTGELNFVILTDITARKQAEEALHENERKLNEASKLAQIGHWIWDVKTGNVEWSEEVFNIFQLNPKEFTPHIDSILELSPWPEDHERDKELIRKAMETREKGNYEQRFLRPDKSIGYYYSTFQGKYDNGGNLISIVGTVQDITKRRQTEEEIRTLNAELEQRVKERTSQLEEANRELEAFAYSVSHDLKAPLRAIGGFSQILLEENAAMLGARGISHIGRVRNAAGRMGQLIDDLLRLSRIMRTELTRRSVDLTDLAINITAELQKADPGRQVEFVIAPSLSADADFNLIAIAVDNLLGNAWKFTSKHKSARIEMGSEELEGETVFFVRDDGDGFDNSYVGKIFDPFQRLHNSGEFEGTGIGLAIVHRIINRHGGRIRAEGKVGEGAVFRFTLKSRQARESGGTR